MAAPPTFPSFGRRGPSWPIIRTPINSTDKEVAISGKEARFPLWSYPRYRFELSFNYLSADAAKIQDWQTLQGFWNSVYGPAGLFLFDFPEDDTATAQQFGTGNGTTTAFQLTRTLGGFVEPVFAPTITNIKINGTPTGAYTLGALGVITFSSPPAGGAVLTWNGTFTWYCRFDDDAGAQFNNIAYRFWQLGKLSFTTAKLP